MIATPWCSEDKQTQRRLQWSDQTRPQSDGCDSHRAEGQRVLAAGCAQRRSLIESVADLIAAIAAASPRPSP